MKCALYALDNQNKTLSLLHVAIPFALNVSFPSINMKIKKLNALSVDNK